MLRIFPYMEYGASMSQIITSFFGWKLWKMEESASNERLLSRRRTATLKPLTIKDERVATLKKVIFYTRKINFTSFNIFIQVRSNLQIFITRSSRNVLKIVAIVYVTEITM